jgi:hypothetical protein
MTKTIRQNGRINAVAFYDQTPGSNPCTDAFWEAVSNNLQETIDNMSVHLNAYELDSGEDPNFIPTGFVYYETFCDSGGADHTFDLRSLLTECVDESNKDCIYSEKEVIGLNRYVEFLREVASEIENTVAGRRVIKTWDGLDSENMSEEEFEAELSRRIADYAREKAR